MKKTIYILFFCFLGFFVWGNRIEPRLIEMTKHKVTIKGLGHGWVGKKVAFFSDFQIGMWLGNESTVEAAVTKLLEIKPEVVLIGGDFIYHPTDDDLDDAKEDWGADDRKRAKKLIEKATSLLKPLTDAKIKVLAVLGNHDYSMAKHSSLMVEESASLLKKKLKSINIRVLENESVGITIDNDQLNFVGIAPFYPDLDNAKKALLNLDKQPRVLFMHNANSLNSTPANAIQFAVAGHTHGGQIRIPGFPEWSWTSLVPQSPDEVKGDGWIPNYKKINTKLYINRGIGFSSYPIRINCRPEVTLFELQD
jgi:hypothetical protein